MMTSSTRDTAAKKYTLCLAGLTKECASLAEAQHYFTREVVPMCGGRFGCPDGTILTARTYYTIEALRGWVRTRAGRVVLK